MRHPGLRFAGVNLDAARNADSPPNADVAAVASPGRVLTVKARENWRIARECGELLGGSGKPD